MLFVIDGYLGNLVNIKKKFRDMLELRENRVFRQFIKRGVFGVRARVW